LRRRVFVADLREVPHFERSARIYVQPDQRHISHERRIFADFFPVMIFDMAANHTRIDV
jgi:hypothetical protein